MTKEDGDSELFREAIDEIEATSSDRAAAVVAGAFLEDHLTKAIQARMHKNEKIFREMFRPSGSLGNFGTKVDLGYMIGMYSEKVRRELQTVKEIRNEFAHKLKTKSFDCVRVKALSANLKLIEAIKFTISNPENDKPITSPFPKTGDLTARERYVATCQLLIGLFGLLKPPKEVTPEI